MINAIVTDIEGTTTSVNFVYEVLFPYARNHICTYLQDNKNKPDIKSLLTDIQSEAGKKLSLEQTCALLQQWMDEDRKITSLKTLQGFIWADGYRKGGFTGHIYADVPKKLAEWKQSNISIYVYSSGSIKAQKLLFSHTNYGDLTRYFDAYFDTTTGNKREIDSYRKIASILNLEPDRILFLSDVTQELDAASKAGFNTILVDRKNEFTSEKYRKISSFDEIKL